VEHLASESKSESAAALPRRFSGALHLLAVAQPLDDPGIPLDNRRRFRGSIRLSGLRLGFRAVRQSHRVHGAYVREENSAGIIGGIIRLRVVPPRLAVDLVEGLVVQSQAIEEFLQLRNAGIQSLPFHIQTIVVHLRGETFGEKDILVVHAAPMLLVGGQDTAGRTHSS